MQNIRLKLAPPAKEEDAQKICPAKIEEEERAKPKNPVAVEHR